MFLRMVAVAAAIGLLSCGDANASIIALIKGNDTQAINWLANYNSPKVSGLTMIVKDNIDGNLEGDDQVGWSRDSNVERSGSWTHTTTSFTPSYWFVKFDGLVAIYKYDGSGTSPFSDSFNLDTDVWSSGDNKLKIAVKDEYNNTLYNAGTSSENGKGHYGEGNLKVQAGATTSHISVYGSKYNSDGVIPEPGTMTIWAVGCLAAFGGGLRRRR